MKIVEVNIRASEAGEVAYGVVAVQRRDEGSSTWYTDRAFFIRSDDMSANRSMLLEDNERVIVEGRSNVEMVFDAKQNMMMPKAVVVTQEMIESLAAPLLMAAPPGPLPEGPESRIGVWREDAEADWSRTGKRYRTY